MAIDLPTLSARLNLLQAVRSALGSEEIGAATSGLACIRGCLTARANALTATCAALESRAVKPGDHQEIRDFVSTLGWLEQDPVVVRDCASVDLVLSEEVSTALAISEATPLALLGAIRNRLELDLQEPGAESPPKA
ncbi:MAG TPA: hypothetical protein VN042_07610 [Asticcacaulis sp.]|nr:hypothetical protein [Asticcacaulis sp.]